jgi:hypothetical protein
MNSYPFRNMNRLALRDNIILSSEFILKSKVRENHLRLNSCSTGNIVIPIREILWKVYTTP